MPDRCDLCETDAPLHELELGYRRGMYVLWPGRQGYRRLEVCAPCLRSLRDVSRWWFLAWLGHALAGIGIVCLVGAAVARDPTLATVAGSSIPAGVLMILPQEMARQRARGSLDEHGHALAPQVWEVNDVILYPDGRPSEPALLAGARSMPLWLHVRAFGAISSVAVGMGALVSWLVSGRRTGVDLWYPLAFVLLVGGAAIEAHIRIHLHRRRSGHRAPG